MVEDEKPLRKAIVDVLQNKKFRTLEARNGEEGLDIALAQKPDLILLDLLMPEVDGMTVLKKIRKNSWGMEVPVIILTNLNPSTENIVEDVITHKPLFYLIKSDWKLYDIASKIEQTLEAVA